MEVICLFPQGTSKMLHQKRINSGRVEYRVVFYSKVLSLINKRLLHLKLLAVTLTPPLVLTLGQPQSSWRTAITLGNGEKGKRHPWKKEKTKKIDLGVLDVLNNFNHFSKYKRR